MNEWKWHDEIVTAILTGDDVNDAADKLVKQKRQEVSQFEKEMKEQTESAKLLIAGLKMPEGSAGQRMATAILSEMRVNYKDAAAKADATITRRRAADEAELDRICRK